MYNNGYTKSKDAYKERNLGFKAKSEVKFFFRNLAFMTIFPQNGISK